MSPELPDMTARGEVWSVGAIMVSLCLLLHEGPIKKRNWIPNWVELPSSRKGVRDMYLGDQYSRELRHQVRDTIRYRADHRPFSWKLRGDVRAAKAEADYEFEPLPLWAFGRSQDRN